MIEVTTIHHTTRRHKLILAGVVTARLDRPMPRKTKKLESVSTRLDAHVREALDRYAAEDRRSLSWIINEACREYVERREGKGRKPG